MADGDVSEQRPRRSAACVTIRHAKLMPKSAALGQNQVCRASNPGPGLRLPSLGKAITHEGVITAAGFRAVLEDAGVSGCHVHQIVFAVRYPVGACLANFSSVVDLLCYTCRGASAGRTH